MPTTVTRYTDEDFARWKAEREARVAEETRRGNAEIAASVARRLASGEPIERLPLHTTGWDF